ncbi:TetR/AcrR family transcriptional regulator [Oceanobacillus piezotolerans]|uniref:TetR/AcrR family transcriptional regulator n=1 Tax=Oceanobacillus piezotolerans TaxID=2448030 RepID=A0A498DAF4_9BACI|nr:TetR/AcrR family transcriptional regulator [Oceanobacillus piezotolerans]RLL41788.1 TetR/AcrR family transcriptional regulator [Oceanobacillus piezotolerans]
MSLDPERNLTKKGLNTRRKLLKSAEGVFGTKGYFEASIVEITQEANVAQGTFYKYFPSKKAIYDELVHQMSRDLRLFIKQAIEKSPQVDMYRRGFEAFFEWVGKNQNLYSIVLQAVIVDKDLYRWYYEKLANGYIRVLKEADKTGEFKELNHEALAYSLMGIGQFLGMRWVYWEGEEVPKEVLDVAMEMVLQGILK